MKYIVLIFLCITNLVHAMESLDKENERPQNALNSVSISDPTLTKKIRELEIMRDSYQGFVLMYNKEIKELSRLDFFKIRIDDQNEEVMSILHALFSNSKKSEVIHPILSNLENCPTSFRQSMKVLSDEVKQRRDEPNLRIRNALEELSKSFGITQLMVQYYWKNQAWFLNK